MSANPSAGAESASELAARTEAERVGQPFLLYRDGGDNQQIFSLEPGLSQASVGRERTTDLVLHWDEQVSRIHARFERDGEDWTLVDDGLSRNGTFVNGQRLSGGRHLTDGDTLRFGTTTMTFRAPRAAEQAGTAIAGAAAPGAGTAIAGAGTPSAGEVPAGLDLSTTQHRVLVALCRPYKESTYASPATNQQIADDIFISVAEVKTHLTILFAKFEVDQLPENQRRARLVEQAFSIGLISESDL